MLGTLYLFHDRNRLRIGITVAFDFAPENGNIETSGGLRKVTQLGSGRIQIRPRAAPTLITGEFR